MESVEALLDNSEEVYRLEIPYNTEYNLEDDPVRVLYEQITEKELSSIKENPKAKRIQVKDYEGAPILMDRIYDAWVSYLDLSSEEMTKIVDDPKVRHTQTPIGCEYKGDDGKVYTLPPKYIFMNKGI